MNYLKDKDCSTHHIQSGTDSQLDAHVKNTTVHLTSNDRELLQRLSDMSDTNDYVTNDELTEYYYSKQEIDDKNFLTSIPDEYVTENELDIILSDGGYGSAEIDGTSVIVSQGMQLYLTKTDSGKIKLSSYTKPTVTVNISPVCAEWNTEPEVSISITNTGTITSAKVSGGNINTATDIKNTTVTDTPTMNTDAVYVVTYKDSKTTQTASATFTYKQAFLYGTTQPTQSNFQSYSNRTLGKPQNITMTISSGRYGWFATPDTLKLTDVDTGFEIGIINTGTFVAYGNVIYNVYRTTNQNLGTLNIKVN